MITQITLIAIASKIDVVARKCIIISCVAIFVASFDVRHATSAELCCLAVAVYKLIKDSNFPLFAIK